MNKNTYLFNIYSIEVINNKKFWLFIISIEYILNK